MVWQLDDIRSALKFRSFNSGSQLPSTLTKPWVSLRLPCPSALSREDQLLTTVVTLIPQRGQLLKTSQN